MTKIILTEAQTQRLISELFSQKLVQQLADRFKQEDPGLKDRVINFYINRFQQIKDNPKVENKDITTYSWDELVKLVDMNQPEDIQIKADNNELIYNQNNLKIYKANTKQACVKYGTGYNFCISSRGEDNQYDFYRFGDGESPGDQNTIYFIIDEDRPKTQNPKTNGKVRTTFLDPYHMIVLMVQKNLGYIQYNITNADNPGTPITYYKFSDIEKQLPKLKGLEPLFQYLEPHSVEKAFRDFKEHYHKKLIHLYEHADVKWNARYGIIPFGNIHDVFNDLEVINNILNGKPIYIYSSNPDDDGPIPMTYPNKTSHQLYIKHMMDYLSHEIGVEDIDITTQKPDDPKYLEYLKQAKDILMDFLHEKNKFNIPT